LTPFQELGCLLLPLGLPLDFLSGYVAKSSETLIVLEFARINVGLWRRFRRAKKAFPSVRISHGAERVEMRDLP